MSSLYPSISVDLVFSTITSSFSSSCVEMCEIIWSCGFAICHKYIPLGEWSIRKVNNQFFFLVKLPRYIRI